MPYSDLCLNSGVSPLRATSPTESVSNGLGGPLSPIIPCYATFPVFFVSEVFMIVWIIGEPIYAVGAPHKLELFNERSTHTYNFFLFIFLISVSSGLQSNNWHIEALF